MAQNRLHLAVENYIRTKEKCDSEMELARQIVLNRAPFVAVNICSGTYKTCVRLFDNNDDAALYAGELQQLYIRRDAPNACTVQVNLQKVEKTNFDRLDWFSDNMTPTMVFAKHSKVGRK